MAKNNGSTTEKFYKEIADLIHVANNYPVHCIETEFERIERKYKIGNNININFSKTFRKHSEHRQGIQY